MAFPFNDTNNINNDNNNDDDDDQCNKPCAGVFVATPLTVAVIVFVGVVEAAVKIIAVAVEAVAFPLLFDVFIAGKCTNDSNWPKSSASLSIPPTKSTRPIQMIRSKDDEK